MVDFPEFCENFETRGWGSSWSESDNDKKLDVRHYTQLVGRSRGAPVTPRTGAFCMMLDFEIGLSSNEAAITHSGVTIPNGQTKYVTFWHYVSSNCWGPNDTKVSLFELADNVATEMYIRAIYQDDGSDNGWIVALEDHDNGGAYETASTARLNPDRWNHICLRIYNNSAAGEFEMWVNGDPAGAKYTGWNGGADTMNKFILGGRALAGVFNAGFMLFDDFRIWNNPSERPRPDPVDKIEMSRYVLHSDQYQASIAEHVFVGAGTIDRVLFAGHETTSGGNTATLDLYDGDRYQPRAALHKARLFVQPESVTSLKAQDFGPLRFEKGCLAVLSKEVANNKITAWLEIGEKLGDDKATYRQSVANHGLNEAKLYDPNID